jgi:hypothetical protein
MNIVDLISHVSQFNFKLLDTMGYIQDLKISKDSVTCSSPVLCTDMCHHRTWILHKIFDFDKTEALIYKKHFSTNEWSKIVQAFPDKVPLAQLPASKDEQRYLVNVRHSNRDAKCATCKKTLRSGDVQTTTKGSYRTGILRNWIIHTFFFFPKLSCFGTMPRNSYIRPCIFFHSHFFIFIKFWVS